MDKRLQAETTAELDAMLSVILDRVLKANRRSGRNEGSQFSNKSLNGPRSVPLGNATLCVASS
jgi:hypothetical protein